MFVASRYSNQKCLSKTLRKTRNNTRTNLRPWRIPVRLVFISLLTERSYTFTAKRYPFPVHEDAKGEIGYEYVNGNEYEESTVNRINEVSSLIITAQHSFALNSSCIQRVALSLELEGQVSPCPCHFHRFAMPISSAPVAFRQCLSQSACGGVSSNLRTPYLGILFYDPLFS